MKEVDFIRFQGVVYSEGILLPVSVWWRKFSWSETSGIVSPHLSYVSSV
jgi:hypothetical protein